MRQVETAAIKKAGDNKSGPFVRKLTALYTKSTLEVGGRAGAALTCNVCVTRLVQHGEGWGCTVALLCGTQLCPTSCRPWGLATRTKHLSNLQAGELGGMADDGRDDEEDSEAGGPANGATAAVAARPPAASRPAGRRGAAPTEPPANSYLVCIVEEPVGGGGGGTLPAKQSGAAGGPGSGGAGGSTQGTPGASQGPQAVDIGLVAVEPSTGAVLYAQFRWGGLPLGLRGRPRACAPRDMPAGGLPACLPPPPLPPSLARLAGCPQSH